MRPCNMHQEAQIGEGGGWVLDFIWFLLFLVWITIYYPYIVKGAKGMYE
jgi:uncharacterized membrane protein YccF (DUF307 family)